MPAGRVTRAGDPLTTEWLDVTEVAKATSAASAANVSRARWKLGCRFL